MSIWAEEMLNESVTCAAGASYTLLYKSSRVLFKVFCSQYGRCVGRLALRWCGSGPLVLWELDWSSLMSAAIPADSAK
jgi:hypothetical protein